MTVPTPEQFLGTPSTEDDLSGEEQLAPESAAAPREVVEKWTMDPGTMWQIPEPSIDHWVRQIAADVRLLTEHTTNTKLTTDSTNIYVEPLIQSGQVSMPSPGSILGFTPAGAPVFDETAQPAPPLLTEVADHREMGLIEQLADLEAQLQTLTELVDEIKAIVKPSKSQVSLEVKAAIERWANPQVDMAEGDQRLAEAQAAGEVTPTSSQGTEDAGTHTRTPHGDGPDYCFECSQAAQAWVQWPCPAIIATEPEVGPDPEPTLAGPVKDVIAQPATTDHVEAWRKYARAVRPEAKWEGMNRSQIRTALGIAQPVAGA